MRISENLSPEDKALLPKMGIAGDPPHFEKKEIPIPAGMRRLSNGKVIRYTPITELLKNCQNYFGRNV